MMRSYIDHAEGQQGNIYLDASRVRVTINTGAVAELADAGDLKSSEGNLVWVRLPPAPFSFS